MKATVKTPTGESNSVPGWAQIVIAAHLAAASAASSQEEEAVAVSHAARLKDSRRYFCWQEDGGNGLNADNNHDELTVTGYTDLFTAVEFDPAVSALGLKFDAAGLAWEYTGCTYEPDTGFFHHTWEWEVG